MPSKTPVPKHRSKKLSNSEKGKSPSTASASIDEQLAKYRSMRDFSTTAEPSGAKSSGGQGDAKAATSLPFVIQKHAATRLHYDFRLGWQGVLKSWAVAKGPSYVVADKRLAVEVEDHPMEYGGFEGTIPKGQYGGGTVMLWDEGTWEPVGDGEEGFRTGRLKFLLHGKKLKGKWTLIRMGGKAAREAKPNWLLIKEHDEFEWPEGSESITDLAPDSVITGRDMTEIAAAEDHVWDSSSGLAAEERKTATARTKRRKPVPRLDLSRYPKEAMPGFLEPQLASASETPPVADGWVHELKLDGYRMQAHVAEDRVTLYTRTGLDWTPRVKRVAAALKGLGVECAIVDGEIVALDEKGLSSFSELQAAFDDNTSRELTYYCFDLLHLNGHSLRDAPLLERKALLHSLLAGAENARGMLRYSEHLEVDGSIMLHEACALGAEGIISKRADAKYASGRSLSWTKTKCIRRQELVIGGFTAQANKNAGSLGALLLGYYHGDKFIYAGRTGTGFTQQTQRSLRERLESLQIKKSPFDDVPVPARKDAIWVKPELVAEVQFREWTADGMVRQAAFKGLREDKPAAEVRRETEVSTESADEEQMDRGAPTHRTKPSQPRITHNVSIRLTHADRVIDAVSGLTKQMLANYYDAVAEQMLPHIADRPLSIVRCPDGSTGNCFFQKHVNTGLPKGVGSVDVPDKKTGKPEAYITFSTRESLVSMAQMNVLELHPWSASNTHLEQPDRLVFDLDPDEALPWETLAEAAEDVRSRLKKLGLQSFLKGTGGKGLHIVAPIDPDPAHEWPVVKAFAHRFVKQMEAASPRRYLTKMSKAARAGKIYLDYLRNERGATAVAAYSPRRRAGVPVSVPFSWSVLKEKAMPVYRAAEFGDWLVPEKRDPWKQLSSVRQALSRAAIEAMATQ